MDGSTSYRNDKWHVSRSLIRLALEYDSNCIEKWTENGNVLCYSTMSHEQTVMRLFERCGLMAHDGEGVRFRLLHNDFDKAADALCGNVEFDLVLSALVSETCWNGLLSADTEPFDLTFDAKTKWEVRLEIDRLTRHLANLGCLSRLADTEGIPRVQWTDRMTLPMHENYCWGGAPMEE